MQPFVVNRHGRLVFPSNFIPELDFSVIDTEQQLVDVIRRDFEKKAPTGTDILERIQAGSYPNRYALMNDMALNLFWVNRFAETMYDKRPTRWRDVPRQREDVFLPVMTPWEDGERKVASVEKAYWSLPAARDQAVEDRIFRVLFDVFGHRRHHATRASRDWADSRRSAGKPRQSHVSPVGVRPGLPAVQPGRHCRLYRGCA